MNIKHTILTCILIFISCLKVSAQDKKISVELAGAPASELFIIVESTSGCRVFYDAAEIKGIIVTVAMTDRLPAQIIREALKDTDLRVSEFNGDIFILKDRYIATALPDSFFNERIAAVEEEYETFRLDKQIQERAGSEFKIYRVGDPLAPARQRVKVEGVVYNYNSGSPATNINIHVRNTDVSNGDSGATARSVVTDPNGYYTLTLPSGRYELQLTGFGFKDSKRVMDLYSNGTLDIEILERVISIDEILVYSGKKSNVLQPALGIERLQIKEVKNIPTPMGEGDVMRVVTMLPGVKSSGEVSSGFNVRGGSTDQNLVLFNESILYNPTHVFGILSGFNPDLIDNMELYKSSIPAKYGGRISSVMEVNNRDGNMEEYSGSASIGLLTSRALIEGPIVKNKGSFILGGRMTYSDWILNLINDESYMGGTADFYDVTGGLTYHVTPNDRVRLNGYYSHDQFNFETWEKYEYNNINTSLKWQHDFNSRLTADFSGGFDRYDHLTRNTADPAEAYEMEFAINQIFGKANFTWQASDQHTMEFGLNTLYYNLNSGTQRPLGSESGFMAKSLQNEKALESAIYISDQWNITDDLTLDGGIRYSMFNVLGPRSYSVYQEGSLPSDETKIDSLTDQRGILKTYHGAEFRASARYAFSNSLSVKAGVNTMRQYIHKVSNNTIMAPTDTWKLSDVNIQPQTGMQASAGLYKNFMENKVETSVEVYYKKMSNYLDYRPGAEIVMNPALEREVLTATGRAYGVEIMLRKKAGKLNGWVSYAYSRTELRQDDERVENPVNDGDWYPSDFDKPHEFKFIGNYKITHRYSVSMNCEYATGRPITYPISKYYYEGATYVNYSKRNQYRVPDYFRMDVAFNIEPQHRKTAWVHYNFSIGVYNVTGRKNAHSIYYNKDEDGVIRGYMLSIFGAPIPYISLNLRF